MYLVTKYCDELNNDLLFIMGFSQKIKDEHKWYSLPEILTNGTILDTLLKEKQFPIYLRQFSNFVLPTTDKNKLDNDNILLLEEDDDIESDYSLPVLCEETFSSSKEKLNLIIETLNENEEVITSEELERIITSADECIKNILANSFKFVIRGSIEITRAWDYKTIKNIVEEYNDNSSANEIDYYQERTKKIAPVAMKEPTDKLMAFFPNNIYYSKFPNYKDVITELTLNIIRLSPKAQPYGDLDVRVDAKNYKDVLKGIPKEYIQGNDSNNLLPIQENEIDFYNNLNNLIKDYIKSYCKEMGVSSEEEANYYNNWAGLTELIRILEAYLAIYVSINWAHCYKIPVNEVALSLDSSDDDSSDESVSEASDGIEYALSDELYAKMDTSSTVSTVQSYKTVLKHFLLNNNCSIFGYSEAIVKIARWGERKPHNLVLTESLSNSSQRLELDLNTFETSNSESAISSIEAVGDRTYVLCGYVKQYKDTVFCVAEPELQEQLDYCYEGYNPDVVTGLLCYQKIKIGDIEKDRWSILDLTYVISRYREGKYDIYGLDYVDGKFKVNLDNNLTVLSTGLDLKAYINSTDKTKKQFISDSVNLSKYMVDNINLSREEWKEISLNGVISRMETLLDANYNTRVSNLFNCSEGVLKVTICLIKPYLDYLAELSILQDEGKTLSLEEYLDIFNQCYKGDELTKLQGMEIDMGNEEDTNEVKKTSNFAEKVKETLPVVFEFVVNNDVFYAVTNYITKSDLGLSLALIKETTDYNFEKSSIKTSRKGMIALYSLLTLYLDNEHKNKIFVPEKAKEEIEAIKNNLIGENVNMLKACNFVRTKLQK